MPSDSPETIESFHSKDFLIDFRDISVPPKITGLTQTEWETRFESVGAIEHLKGLGWSDYQWCYTAPAVIEPIKTQVTYGSLSCFAEFFSRYYHGYLRGDGATVKEAILSCLNRAQNMAQCEVRTNGHIYTSRPEYTNGYVTCEFCGFHGFSPQVQTLKSANSNMKSHIKVLQFQMVQTEEAIRKAGLRWSMKDFMSTLERIPKEQHAG